MRRRPPPLSRLGALTGLWTLACLAVLLPRTAAAEDAPVGHVSLPLTVYEQMQKKDQRPSLTVVESLRISGSFQRRDLTLTFAGRAAGLLPSVPVLLPGASGGGVRLHGCEGDAILSHGGTDASAEAAGGFELLPLKSSFSVRCRLAPRGSDRLELRVTPAVLYVDASVDDGEFIQSDAEGQDRVFSVVRLSGSPAETLRPSATARYRLSLFPDETRFRYQIDVRNPNRSTQPFTLTLKNGEVIQQVDAQARWEIDGRRYRFDLPPGERTLVLQGTLAGDHFAPPVEASVQYALVESHPLLRPQLSGAARRIGPSETRITAEFRGAQAFLLGEKEVLQWKVSRLSALRTTSFAVPSAQHRFFLSTDGQILGESEITLDNQGAPDLTLPIQAPAEPTFASLKGEPVFLTRNEAGQLWLPISQGEQRVLVQHRQRMTSRLGVVRGTLYLPQLRAPTSHATVELRFPQEWRPLYADLAPEYKTPSLDSSDLLWLALLLLWTDRCLAALRMTRAGRLWLVALLAPLVGLSTAAATLLGGADLAVSALSAVPLLRRLGRRSLGLGLFAGAGLCFLVLVMLVGGTARMSAPTAMAPRYGKMSSMDNNMANDIPCSGSTPEQAPARPAEPGGTYEGLPAKFDMPSGAQQVFFTREMLNTEAPRAVRVILLARRTEATLALAALLLALAALLWRRRTLHQGALALWDRAWSALPPPTPAPPPLPAD